jgi:integrase
MDTVSYSYEGPEAAYRGKLFRLGAKVEFVASDPTLDEWRHLMRVLYADGGYFASGCTYAEFLAHRFDPRSETSRSARLRGVSGVTLHSYRYAWVERARTASVPERFAQEALGHNSLAVHRAYAKKAKVKIPSPEEYERKIFELPAAVNQ